MGKKDARKAKKEMGDELVEKAGIGWMWEGREREEWRRLMG